jgi:hypothetical protein
MSEDDKRKERGGLRTRNEAVASLTTEAALTERKRSE